jgi:hypothetical protein
MSQNKSLTVSLFAAMLMVPALSAAPVLADEEGGHRAMTQMAQGGPGMGGQSMGGQGGRGPGQMMQGERGPQAGGDRASRRERWMQHMAERRIELLDTDKDGKISATEIVAEQKRLFAAADVNGDGKLSAEEFRRRGRWFVRLGTMSFFDMLDADGDGQLSATELTGPSERWFKRYDADKNGTIDINEYVRSREHGGRRGGQR